VVSTSGTSEVSCGEAVSWHAAPHHCDVHPPRRSGAAVACTSGPRVARLAAKYAPLVPVLTELIARPDTPSRSLRRESSANLDLPRSGWPPP